MKPTYKIIIAILILGLIISSIYLFISFKNKKRSQFAQVSVDVPSEQGSWTDSKYLMAFHACDTATTDCTNPKNHQTYIAQSNDGQTWQPIPDYTPYQGSVPDIIRRKNTIYIFNPGQVRKYHIDTGIWDSPVSITLDGNQGKFVDPSAILDDNNNIVLFYLLGQKGGDPARCPEGQSSCTKIFDSATEIDGSDGTKFVVDSGHRTEIEIGNNDIASDPDIFKGASDYVLYLSLGRDIEARTAQTLLSSYEPIPTLDNGILSQNIGGVSAGYYDPITKQYWTYLHTEEGSVNVIQQAVSSTLDTPLSTNDFTTVISGATYPGLGDTYSVESPSFAINMP